MPCGVSHAAVMGGTGDGGVLVVTGISAAGKSTVAQAIAERIQRSVHLRGDTFRRMIVNGQAEMCKETTREALAQLRLRHRLTAAIADAYHDSGFTVIVQDVLLGGHLTEFTETIRARPLAVVVLAPNRDVVEARERARNKTGYGPASRPGDLDDVLRAETPKIGLWLDNSAHTVAGTACEILDRAWSAGRIR